MNLTKTYIVFGSLHNILIRVCALLLCLTSLALPTHAAYRGFNISKLDSYTQADFYDIYAAGARVVRCSFSSNVLATWEKGDQNITYNQANIDLMHDVIRMANNAGLRVIVDPHKAFGQRKPYSMNKYDSFWNDGDYKNKWGVALGTIAYELRDYQEWQVWGIQLLNEPPADADRDSLPENVVDLNNAYKHLINKVRAMNSDLILFLGYEWKDLAAGYTKKPTWFNTASDATISDKIRYDVHMYDPPDYTLQGTTPRWVDVEYPPTSTDSEYWRTSHEDAGTQVHWATSQRVNDTIDQIENWLVSNNVSSEQLLIGEWGLTQGYHVLNNDAQGLAWDGNTARPSNGGRDWMVDVYSRIRNWNWCLHTYKGGNISLDQTQPEKRWELVKLMLQNTNPELLP